MSNPVSLHSSKKKFIKPGFKPKPALSINIKSFQSLDEDVLPYTSQNLSQKENSNHFVMLKSNSSVQNELLKSQQSHKSLRPSLQQIKNTNSFNILPNTTRNQDCNPGIMTGFKANNLVTRSVDFSIKSPETIYKEHLFQTFQAMKFVRTLAQPDISEINTKKIWLPKRKGYENSRTIIFDLDETLVHCVEDPGLGDFSINIKAGTVQGLKVGINIRPYAREVLASANRDFEVMIFTASQRCYADEVMDYLDPTGELIHHRLYRDSCIVKSGVYIKDLRIFANRNISDTIIVDNSAYCFGYQLENGIPIISWFNDKNDRELHKLIQYIKILAEVPDISSVNRHTFQLNSFYTDYIRDYLKFQDREI